MIRRLFACGRVGPRVACRLLQPNRSTSTTFERTARTPRTASAVAHRRSSFRGWLRWSQIDGTLSSAWSLERGQSGVHGSGARGPGARSPALPRAPPLAIARNGSFAPTRSTRTPPVANPWRCRLESPASPELRFPKPAFTSLPDDRRRSDVRRSGPPRTLLREEWRAPLHPRCLPSPD